MKVYPPFTVSDLSPWLTRVSRETFFETARGRPPGMWKNPDLRPLLHEIRGEVPVSGDDWVKDIEVLVEPGQRNHQGQVSHAHDEWTAVFYVDPAGVPIYINDLAYYPNPGDVVVMPPLVVHRVAENNTDKPRLSFAMLVEDPDIPSKFRH